MNIYYHYIYYHYIYITTIIYTTTIYITTIYTTTIFILQTKNSLFSGGFNDSSLMKSELISAYVPFLPLEREHVRECVYHSLSKAGYLSDTLGSKIETYVNDIMSGRKSTMINGKEYFNEGCKKLDEQVHLAFEDSMDDEL